MGYEPQVWLVTRAYQTRHGNGPMTNENIFHTIKYNTYERNGWSCFQGYFRRAILDLDLIKYSINIDPYFKTHKINLIITCIDLLNEFSYTINGKKYSVSNEKDFIEKIKKELPVENIFISRTPYPELEEHKFNQ
jgi:adenylosuccinate synthase